MKAKGFKLEFWQGLTRGGDVYFYACPDCFREVDDRDEYCSTCGWFLGRKKIDSLKKLKEELRKEKKYD